MFRPLLENPRIPRDDEIRGEPRDGGRVRMEDRGMGEGGTGLGERDETKRVYMYISLRCHKSNIPFYVPPRPALHPPAPCLIWWHMARYDFESKVSLSR